MKPKSRHLGRKILSTVTALSLSASMVVLPVLPTMTANAGTVINLVTGKWSAIGLEYFERGTMRLLGAAASHAENDTIADILTTTKKFLSSPMSNTLGDIKKMCKELDAKLDAISNQMEENQKVLVTKLNGIAAQQKEDAYSGKKSELDKINSHNQYIIGLFQDFSSKVAAADINDQNSLKELRLAYDSLIKIYDSPNGITERTNMTFNYANDAQAIADLISMYDYSYNLQENISKSIDVGDKEGWGAKTRTSNMISAYYDLLPYYDAFDHEYYRDMSAQYDYVADVVANYLESYNLYVSYAAQLIYAGAIDDLDTDERSKQNTVSGLWKDYDQCCYIVMRALAQMVDEYDSKLSGVMREYDTSTSIHFDNIKDSITGSQQTGSGGCYNDAQKSSKNKTSNRMQAYQMRPFGSTTAYALRKTNSSQPAVKMEDMTYYAFDYRVEVFPWYQHECNGYTCDYYNLIMSSATSPTGWNALSGSNQLGGLVDTLAFENLGSGSDSDIIKYLKAHGMSSDLPKIDGSNPYTISNKYEWNVETGGHVGNWDIDMLFYNVSGLKKGSAMGEKYYDMDDDYDDFKGKELSIFYTGEPQVAVYLPSNSGAQYQYSAVDYKGNSVSANGGRNVLKSGGTITLRIKPDEGKYIKSLRLCDRFVYDEDHSKGTLTQYISEDDALYKSNCGIYPESDGYYTVKINVPFRDGSVILDLGDVPTNTNTVELVESESVIPQASFTDLDSGILSFSNFSGETKINANTGDTVSVAVLPYTGYMCSGIEVRGSDGKLYKYAEVDSSEYYSVVHGQKEFSFTMPDDDVTVKAVYGESHKVELVSDDHSSLNFVNDIGTVDDKDDVRSYAPGETVKLCVKASSGYCLAGVTVSDYTNREYLTCDIDGDYISFTMPEGNVVVEAVSEKMDMNQYVAAVNKESVGRIELVNSSGEPINVSSVQVAPGDTVYFMMPSGDASVKDKGGNDIEYTVSDGIYSFVMPESNVEISAVLFEATITDGSVLSFVDKNDNKIDDTSAFYLKDEPVRFVITADSPCSYTIDAQTLSGEHLNVTSESGGIYCVDMPDSDISISAVHSDTVTHNYVNGICTRCGHYEAPSGRCQEASLEFGFLKIRNAGNLLWFASMVNDTNHDKADYTRDTTEACWDCAYIDRNIDLENIPWEPIGTTEHPFEGTVGGDNITIRNLNLDCNVESGDNYQGFVGIGNGCYLYNMTFEGSADLSVASDDCSLTYGTAIAKGSNIALEGITNCIDVNVSSGSAIAGGICGEASSSSDISHKIIGCVNFGNISGKGEKMAGIAASLSDVLVDSCVNIGNVKTEISAPTIAGIAAGADASSTIRDSYNYGGFSSNDKSRIHSIVDSSDASVINCYHLSGTESSHSTAMSQEQFKSGEVAYKLNDGEISGSFIYRQNIDNGKTPEDYPLFDTDSGSVYYRKKENRYSNTPEPLDEYTVSIDENQFVYKDNGGESCAVKFHKNGMSDPLSFKEGSTVTLYYFMDSDHEFTSFKAVGQTTGNVTDITIKSNMSFVVGEEDVMLVPTFTPKDQSKVDVTLCKDDFVFDSNHDMTSYVVFSDTGNPGTRAVDKNTDVTFSYTVDDTHELESLKAVCLQSGRVDDITFSNGSASYHVGEESVRIVPSFKKIEPKTVEVSIDTEKFIVDDNDVPIAYLTFTSTGSSEPCTVDKNSDVNLSYVETDKYVLTGIQAVETETGETAEVEFSNGGAVYHVGNEAVTFVPTFEKIIPATVELSFDTEKFKYDENGVPTAYLTFADSGKYDPCSVKPYTDVMLVVYAGDCEFKSLTAVGKTSGKTESIPVGNDPIIYQVWDEDMIFVPEFDEPVIPEPGPVNVSIDTSRFICYESGSERAYVTFADTGSYDPITADVNSEITLNIHKGDCEFYSLMALGMTTGDLRYVPINGDTVVYRIWDEDVMFIPEFEEPETLEDEPVTQVGISTYEELVEFARKVQTDNETYGKANVWLENSIVAPDDSVWNIPIGTLSNTFAGTFDGRGFGIVGLNVSVDKFGGLFGYVGTKGIVKDLAVIDCEFTTRSECAGGIAAVNNGTIDHCLSGVNIDPSVVIYGKDGKKLYPFEYNSYINGEYSGGIAGVNNGTITGTRNAATINGVYCGGISAANFGTIYGCANNGSTGKDDVKVLACGGLTAYNYGKIGSSYNSGKPIGSSSKNSQCVLGMIVAVNKSSDITDCFCSEINSISAVGKSNDNGSDGNITVLDNTKMLDPGFAQMLNDVTDESVQWAQKDINGTFLNCYYPVILGNFLKNRTLALSHGITMSGLMHDSLNVSYNALGEDEEIYSAFLSALPDRSFTVYGVSCDDGKGGFVPTDFWCSGVRISVPVTDENVTFAVMGSDGTVRLVKPESIENGMATFSAAEPVSFALVTTTSSGTNDPDDGVTNDPDDTDNTDNGGFVPTGESAAAFAALAMMIGSAATIVFARKRKNSK